MNPIRLSLLAERSSYRTDPPGTGEPDWSWTDFSHAAGASGCSELELLALEYRWKQAGRCRHKLYAELMLEAIKAQKRHRWPERLFERRYLEPMVLLALDVEANPRLDGLAPLVVPAGEDSDGKQQYRRFPGWWCLRLPWLSERQWLKDAEPKYAVLRQPLDIWVGEAVRKCARLLRDQE
jgi:hypothetical protein